MGGARSRWFRAESLLRFVLKGSFLHGVHETLVAQLIDSVSSRE
jgi:hypothetical protein